MEPQSPRRGYGRSADIGLRLTGLALLALAWFAIATLMTLRAQAAGAAPNASAYACAALGFVAGNLGAVLMTLGAHVFDEVEVSSRWARHPTAPPSGDSADPGSTVPEPFRAQR